MKKILFIFAFICYVLSALADTTFVAGPISGETWTPAGSPYVAIDNLYIATLNIQPGVDVVFTGNYVFQVNGVVTAVGTEQDSIRFYKLTNSPNWQGILFENTQPGSELAYCKISNARYSGIRLINSAPNIRNCTIFANTATNGGGLSLVFNNSSVDSLVINDCRILNNTAYSNGGGIYANMATAKLIRPVAR